MATSHSISTLVIDKAQSLLMVANQTGNDIANTHFSSLIRELESQAMWKTIYQIKGKKQNVQWTLLNMLHV